MPIDPSIALGVRPAQAPDAADQYGKVLNLLAARQRLQMAPIQMQEAQEQLKSHQIANQEAELKRKDDEILSRTFQAANGDPKKHVTMAAAAGARPQAVQGLDKHYADIREQYAKLSKDEVEVRKYQNSQLAGLTGQALELPDDQYVAAWPQIKAAALQIRPDAQLPDEAPPKAALQHLRLAFTTDELLQKEAEERRKQAEEKRAQELHPAKLAEAQQEAIIKQQEATGQKPIQPVEQERLAGEAEARRQTAENNRILREQGAQRIGIERAREARENRIYEQTYGAGANPALQGVEPRLRSQAAANAQKAADEHTKAMESLRNVESFIKLARSGNKAAGSNLPIMGAESIQALNGIRRINRTEIEQYQGAGSLLDRIQGKIGQIVAGKPIPEDVMNDIEKLHSTIGENAARTYNQRIESINQNYHANFKPVDAPNGGSSLPKGNGQAIDEATARKFYEAAGNDPAKARQMAKDAGWRIQ